MAWLHHLLDRLRGAHAPRAGAQERRVLAIVTRRDSFADERAFLDALSDELAIAQGASPGAADAGEPIEERTVEVLAAHLLGPGGEGIDRLRPQLGRHVDFWSRLAAQSGIPLARACHADLLLLGRDRERALDEFLEALEADPTLVQFRSEFAELARERGGEAHMRYRMACLRGALAGYRPDGEPDLADDDGDDYVRELYGELLEDHRGDAEALARIRELGALIDQAVDRGELPRAIVRRGPRP